MKTGDRVTASRKITEAGFMGKRVHVHALKGDLGQVRLQDGEYSTVTWERTGTTTDCHASEIEPVVTH